MELTKIERDVFIYIYSRITQDGYSPSVRDIRDANGLSSTSVAQKYLGILEEKGYISRASGKSRSIHLKKDIDGFSSAAARIPLIRELRGGEEIDTARLYDGYLDFPINITTSGDNIFAFKLEGTQIGCSELREGDIVVVDRDAPYSNGERVLVYSKTDDIYSVVSFPFANPDKAKTIGRVIALCRIY